MEICGTDWKKLVGVRRFDSDRLRAILTLKGAFGVQNAIAFCELPAPASRRRASVVSPYLSMSIDEQQMPKICC